MATASTPTSAKTITPEEQATVRALVERARAAMAAVADYDQAAAAGEWVPPDLNTVGFIHASPSNQLTRVANKYYTANDEVRIVLLRHEKIRAEVRWEPATGGLYPHIYGPLNMDAAERVVTVRKGADGKFVIGPEQLRESSKPTSSGSKS